MNYKTEGVFEALLLAALAIALMVGCAGSGDSIFGIKIGSPERDNIMSPMDVIVFAGETLHTSELNVHNHGAFIKTELGLIDRSVEIIDNRRVDGSNAMIKIELD